MSKNYLSRIFVTGFLVSGAYAEEPLWGERSLILKNHVAMPEGKLDKKALDELIGTGETLFATTFATLDGVGRPKASQAIIPTKLKAQTATSFARTSGPDASTCLACHNLPIAGGAAGFEGNVFVSEGFTSADFNTTDPEFSNERGSNHLFGSGLVEMLAREMSFDLRKIRADTLSKSKTSGKPERVELVSKGVKFGFITANPDGILNLAEIEGVDADLVVRPFSQKGVMTSIRQFTINALNQHHGMLADERYGTRWTGQADFDEDGILDEIQGGDVSALVAWQATLPAPQITVPEDADWQKAAELGKASFDTLGCNSCHMQSLPLTSLEFADPGPFDAQGTLNTADVKTNAVYDFAQFEWVKNLEKDKDGNVLVQLFGDLKRHKMTDGEVDTLGNERMSQRFVGRDTFITAELWGVGSTEPFGHRNDLTTMDEIIRAHGGEGRIARDAYIATTPDEQSNIVAFLKTLKIVDAQ